MPESTFEDLEAAGENLRNALRAHNNKIRNDRLIRSAVKGVLIGLAIGTAAAFLQAAIVSALENEVIID